MPSKSLKAKGNRRTARFDLLILLGDVGLIDARPGSCYLKGSTGPLKAARRIWPGRSVRELEKSAITLGRVLGVSYEVLEDAMCIWQKG